MHKGIEVHAVREACRIRSEPAAVLWNVKAATVVDKSCELVTAFGGKSPGREHLARDFLFPESRVGIEGGGVMNYYAAAFLPNIERINPIATTERGWMTAPCPLPYRDTFTSVIGRGIRASTLWKIS